MLDENETVEMIKTINDEHQMVVDPHTAVGIGAVRKLGLEKNCVVLSTAHPCKFPKAIEDAISKTENLPDSLKYVNDRKEKFELLSNDIEKVKKICNEFNMKLKIKDQLPDTEIFQLVDGEPQKSKLRETIGNGKSCFVWFTWGIYINLFQTSLTRFCSKCR